MGSPSMLALLGSLARQLAPARRWQLAALALVMLASGLAELVSLAAIVPFLAVLTDPQPLWHQPGVRAAAAALGLVEPRQLLGPATLLFAAASLLAAAIRLLNLWLNGRLAAAVGSDLSRAAYSRILHQPYQAHLRRNSSDVMSAITRQTTRSVEALQAWLQLVSGAVVAAALWLGLMLLDGRVALLAASLFGGSYGLIAWVARRRLRRNGVLVAQAANQQVRALQEGLGSIRDVLLDGSQDLLVGLFGQADRPMRRAQVQVQFLEKFPRYAVEALGLCLIAALGFGLVGQQGHGLVVIPLLGTFALGAQRLLPAFQQIYANWALLRSALADMAAVLAILETPQPRPLAAQGPWVAFKQIEFASVHFRYGPDSPEVLQGLQLTIRRGERVGLIGSSGSGKSTTVDVLMGLLPPTAGRLLVDGLDVHVPDNPQRLLAWRAAIAHVPQSLVLVDGTIADNIAFGVPRAQIDLARVRAAAAQAQLAGWIVSSPAGYDSLVGEWGIRMSGGQRQRLGLARALYKQAQLLILDEATSALDTATEAAVMDAVDGLSPDLTMVIIAHRLSTLRRCDRIIRLDQGCVS